MATSKDKVGIIADMVTSEGKVTVVTGVDLKKDLLAMAAEKGYQLAPLVMGWLIEKRDAWKQEKG